MTLAAAIKELQSVENELVKVTSKPEALDRRQLLKLRAALLQGMMALGQTAQEDKEFASDPERLKKFRQRHNEIKNHLSQHQAKWMPGTIAENQEEYNKDAHELRRANAEFFEFAAGLAS